MDKQEGWSPLHDATWYGNLELVKLLLENGADVNTKTEDGWTPLHRAAVTNPDNVEIVKLLLESGADVNR